MFNPTFAPTHLDFSVLREGDIVESGGKKYIFKGTGVDGQPIFVAVK